MRKATLTERKQARGLTWEELSNVSPPWVVAGGPPSQFVKRYQLECKWPTKMGYAYGSIKAINTEKCEWLIDLGFGDVFWASEAMGDDAPIVVRIGWRR